MTMTMTMTMTMSTFPARNWDPALRFNLELIKFMGGEALFEQIELPEVPTPEDTRREIAELRRKQKVREGFLVPEEHAGRQGGPPTAEEVEIARRRGSTIRQRIKEQVSMIPDFHRVMMFTPQSHPATVQLMTAMTQIGTIGAMYFKNRFLRPRPSQLEPELRTYIDVPPHPSYPSGHATQAHLVARALSTVSGNPELGEELFRIADDVAVNREYAGVHYASDSEAGRLLAHQLFCRVEKTMEETLQNAIWEWR